MILSALIMALAISAFNPEISRGFVLDANGNGIEVKANNEPVDEVYNYVHYSEKEKGTEILSLYLYDPRYIGKHEDDIVFRQDITLSKGNDVTAYTPYANRLEESRAMIVLEDGNFYTVTVLVDNHGTETPVDDTFETIW